MNKYQFLNDLDQKYKELKSSYPLIKTAEKLIEVFDNAYYSLALDGHEASTVEKAFLAELPSVVELFRYIQEDIVNRIYISPNGSTTDVVGRISGDDGVKKFQEYFEKNLTIEVEKELASARSRLSASSS
jgi:hypothetical protein